MRFLLSKISKRELFLFLRKKYKCSSIQDLAKKMNLHNRTLQDWLYEEKRYVPEEIIPGEIKSHLEILDRKQDNWGQIQGGKKTYKILIKKYGLSEIKKRQIQGGLISRKISQINERNSFYLDTSNPLFLEFYGVLLGDGWMSKLNYKNKQIWLLGISGNRKLDKEFFLYLKKNVKELFNRKAYLKERPKTNSIELNFSHKILICFLNKELGFPIGKKVDLKIDEKLYSLGYDKVKYILRGIFDTDGSFYLDKDPNGKPYPCIAIHMKAPILINQIKEILLKEGFRVRHYKNKTPTEQIVLKGKIQLKKWMQEIGSSNPKHLNKIALVA